MMRKTSIRLKKCIHRFHRRTFSVQPGLCEANTSSKYSDDILKIRNIGILAHIDAGKTTTTERMLFYSGRIKAMGEVHQGNTVTDYMEQERNRGSLPFKSKNIKLPPREVQGITITSAAVTFYWLKHRLNLIDTPGHIDFTMEVEQALRVMDGAVVVLDSSAGVEAQTLTVWRQADRYGIPKIVYANKMDRVDGDLNLCISTLVSKLGVYPLPLQIPLRNNGKLVGILDVIRKEKCVWKGNRGEKCERTPLVESDGKLWEEVMTARADLADKLSDIDDNLADFVISLDSLDHLDENHLVDAVRRATISQKGVPVICGSSYKNIGVQLLMDSVISYLPSPVECQHHKLLNNCFKEQLSSKVFKIIHDKQRGPVTFLRIYSGTLNKGQKVYSVKQKKSEQINKLMVAMADDYDEVKELPAGNVAAVTGLKNIITGDLLCSSGNAVSSARNYLIKEEKLLEDEADDFLSGVNIPDPVFFCSIEPASLKFQVPLEAALKELQREDPSLHVEFDSETGQTVLGGMGELHLEIIKQRIESEYKVEVDLGPLQIAYKEQLSSPTKCTHELKHTVGNTRHSVKIILSGDRVDSIDKKKELLTLDKNPDSVANVSSVTPRQLMLIKQGIKSSLLHGPTLGSPVIDIAFKLHWLEVGRGTSESMLIAAASQCVRKVLEESGTILLEPVMSLEIVTDSDSLSAVMSDLSVRRATIESIGMRGNNKFVLALVPLSELLGYSKDLRIITSGVGSFNMEFYRYQQLTQQLQEKVIQQTVGI